jgi:gliding motility-associated-like protein
LCTSTASGYAQTTDTCPVIAKIWPPNPDSTLPANSSVQFTSISENATSYKWLYQGFWSGLNDIPWNYSTSVGFQAIGLVASNGVCSDTTTVLYFSPGTAHNNNTSLIGNYGYSRNNEYAEGIAATLDGSFIIGGDRYLSGWCGTEGALVKLRDRGCVDWSKKIVDLNPVFCKSVTVKGVLGGRDSSIFISAQLGLVTIKLDKNGNHAWTNRWQVEGPSGFLIANSEMTSDQAGNLYLMSGNAQMGITLTKIDPAGDVLWSKYYRLTQNIASDVFNGPYVTPRHITWLNNKIYIAGNRYHSFSSFGGNFIIQVDAVTGQTGWQHVYTNNISNWRITQLSSFGDLLLAAGQADGVSATIIDQSGNVRKNAHVIFPNSNYNPQITRAEADANGNIYLMQWVKALLPLQPGYANYTNFARIDTSFNKYWGVTYSTTPGGGFFVGTAMNNKNSFGAVAQDYGLVAETSLGSVDFRFLKIDSTFNTQLNFGCGYDAPFTLSAIPVDRQNFRFEVDSQLVVTKQAVTSLKVVDDNIQARYTCPDFVDSCNYLKLTGPRNLCSPAGNYTFKLIRNRKCALIPQWQVPAGVNIVNQTDSGIVLRFPSFGEYKISVGINGCFPMTDTLLVSIKPKYQVNLGKDTSICNNAPITLRAGRVFRNYLWNTGATDSLLTVTQPGLYWVEVIDSCGNQLRDSILINNFNFPISIGPDRTKCNTDTIRLSAPDGFLNYQWSNNYNISSTNGQTVIVNPLVDTSYYLKAEKLPGCFSFDTVKIKVNTSPRIYLGQDTSFCIGQSLNLDAGPGFSQYQWNNGLFTRQITVNTNGIYSVAATTSEGCKSADTIRVINIWPLPLVSIQGDSTLCEGGSRLLDAGSFSAGTRYRWNQGSTTQTITVQNIGVYSVEVTNENGCVNSDSFSINRIVPLPEKFLPLDTAICSYGKLELSPNIRYNSYLWNNGSRSRSLVVTKPGQYWLEVIDENKCAGRDTVLVNQKDCLKGLFVPTAFTPNGDGRNDVFKALLFGNIRSFELSVFNRWGQLVFRSNDPMKGWDGRFGGNNQNTGTYVWVCKYQLGEEPLKTERGTVVLIR